MGRLIGLWGGQALSGNGSGTSCVVKSKWNRLTGPQFLPCHMLEPGAVGCANEHATWGHTPLFVLMCKKQPWGWGF